MLSTQSFAQQVPSDINGIAVLNVGALNKKLDTKFKLELDTAFDQLTKVESILLNAVKSPRQMGLDVNRPVIMYHQPQPDKAPSGDHQVVVLPLANMKLFEEVVIKRLEASSKMERKERDGQKYFNFLHTNVVYNNEVAVVQKTDNYKSADDQLYSSQYYYEYNQVIKAINSERMGMQPRGVPGGSMNVEQELEVISQQSQHLAPSEGDEEMAEGVEIEDAVEAVDAPTEEVFEVVEEAIDAEEVVEEADFSEYRLKRKDPNYDYDNHPLMKAFEQSWISRNRDRIVRENLRYELENLEKNKKHLEPNGELNPGIQQALNTTHDASLWYSANSVNAIMGGALGYSYKRLMKRKSRSEMETALEGNYTLGHLDFKGQEVEINMINHLSDDFKKYNALVNEPVNPKFQYYLPAGTSIMYSTYLNPEKLFNMYMDVIEFGLSSDDNPRDNSKMISFDLLEMFLDKDMAFNTMRGDILYAMPGFRTKIEEDMRYVYNPETFEREYKKVTDTTVVPEVIAMSTIKSKDQFNELLGAFVNRGFLVEKGPGVYQVVKRIRRTENEMSDYYVGVKEDVLIVTNHEKLATQYMNSGLPKGMRMELADMQMLTKPGTNFQVNSNFFDMPISKGSRYLRKMPLPMDDFGEIGEVFDTMKMHSSNKSDGEVESKITVKLKNDTNILLELVQAAKNK